MYAVDLQHALSRAVAWAEQAGELALSRFGTALTSERKSDGSLVTEVDRQVERLILDHVAREFPSFGIVAEETLSPSLPPNRTGGPEWCWVIDPLDGTRNFVLGIPVFCVAIVLLHQGRPQAAVVRNPIAGASYTAAVGQGAYLGARRLRVASAEDQHRTIIGIPTARQAPLPPAIYSRWVNQAVTRNLGSTSLHLALTAAGAFAACYAQEVKLWDVAAGALLVEEAGGLVTNPAGGNIFPLDPNSYRGQNLAFLAGTPQVHNELLRSL